MNNLANILKEHGIDENETADMLYAYLTEYGEDRDQCLIIAIYQRFFKRD